MLSKEEKREMLADGKNLSRRKDFRKVCINKNNRSLDDYIKFLMSIQKIFPYKPKFTHTITKLNKL